MPQYASRIISSFFSLALLLVLVFFLSRLTGDPAALFLPVDATPEMLNQFRELHGLNDPIIVQFGRYVWDVLHLDFGESLRQARPAIDIVLQAFVWTLWLAITTIVLVSIAAIVIGSLAAFRPGGIFDRLVSLISLIGASAPDFWIAVVGITVFAIGLGAAALLARATSPRTRRRRQARRRSCAGCGRHGPWPWPRRCGC